MIYFSLRTRQKQEKTKTKKIIKDLTKLFGEEHTSVVHNEWWDSVEIDNAVAWIGVNDIGYKNKSRLHLFSRIDREINYDIPLEQCDTIYCI